MRQDGDPPFDAPWFCQQQQHRFDATKSDGSPHISFGADVGVLSTGQHQLRLKTHPWVVL